MKNIDSYTTQLFVSDMIPDTFLGSAVVWFRDNLLPEEVFTEQQLADWAFENGFRKFE